MALVHVAFGGVGTDVPSFYVLGAAVESVTPSGTNATTTLVALANQRVCRVATDTQIYVSFGSAPNAGTDTVRFLVPAGGVEYFRVSTGDKAAVIAA